MSKEFNLQNFIISTLRRALRRTPQFTIVKQKAWVEKGKYRCNICKNIFHYRKMNMDHVNPIFTIDGSNMDLQSIVDRIFCEESGLQYICANICHKNKTKKENEQRRKNKK